MKSCVRIDVYNGLKGENEMKKEYISPEIDIVKFEAEDVITTSLVNGGEGTGGTTPWGSIQGV